MLTKTLVNRSFPRIGYRYRILIGKYPGARGHDRGFYFIDNQAPHGVLLVWLAVWRQLPRHEHPDPAGSSSEHASSGNGLLSVVMQLSMSLGWPPPPPVGTSFPSASPMRVAAGWRFHLTYLCSIGLMSMLAALIFAQLARERLESQAQGRQLHVAGNRASSPARWRSPAGKSARGGPASR